MFGWISKNAIPDPDSVDWIFRVYAWLLEHTGGFASFERHPLVLPTDEFFPVSADLEGHDLACALFHETKHLAGLGEWPCELVPHTDGPSTKDLLGNVPHGGAGRPGAAGTFSVREDGSVELSYSPRTLKDIDGFIATMAHELAHYLMATIPVPPPGGREAEEPATDLCAVFLGFGAFSANAAFTFRQVQDGNLIGWESAHQGYLDERMLAYALALFVQLRAIGPRSVRSFLKENPRVYMKHALRDVARNQGEKVANLRAIKALSTLE